jgi:hypothetical protein
VTGLPDARMIRWYSTIGIVDKPSGFRGRTALYGYRHLMQLVAVKRLQAQGQPLAEIQAQLAGATEAALRDLAALPAVDKSDAGTAEQSIVDGAGFDAPRPRFWAARPPQGTPQGTPLGTLHGVSLPGGATLLVPAPVHPDQAPAIRRAAQPLLDYLSAHGLLNPDEGAHA